MARTTGPDLPNPVEEVPMAKTNLSPETQARIRKKLWSLPEAAFMLGIDLSYLYRLINGGELTKLKQGRRSFISDRELTAYMARLEHDAG
jgi:excisionase family DNA binding protein